MTNKRHSDILVAAEELFAEKGYRGVSTKDIADAAGVSQGLVHYHFATKERLMMEIVDNVRVPLDNSLRTIVRSDDTVRGKLRGIIHLFTDFTYSHPHAMRVIAFDSLSTQETKEQMLAIREANLAMYAELIKEGIVKGEFKHTDERLAALFIAGVVRTTIQAICLQHLTDRPDKIADDVDRLICWGICGKFF